MLAAQFLSRRIINFIDEGRLRLFGPSNRSKRRGKCVPGSGEFSVLKVELELVFMLITSTAIAGTLRAVIETLIQAVDVGAFSTFQLADGLARRAGKGSCGLGRS